MTEEALQLGPYTLKHRIGAGGMAEVWIAEQTMMGVQRKVAIKLLNAMSSEQQEYRDMFLDEARLTMALNHSSIVQVYNVGEIEGECFIAMEYVNGLNLWELCAVLWERGEQLPLQVSAYVISEVLRALDHAHTVNSDGAIGVVHRDVSPQNVMLSVNGEVKLMDFGVARFSTEETAGVNVKGKIRYMPPEQVQGRSRDPTVDLFAVGAIFYELIEGRRFRDEWEDYQLIVKSMEGVVPPLTQPEALPPQVLTVINGLLEPVHNVRIGSARQALRMLSEWPGLRNAALELESVVTRIKACMPKPQHTTQSLTQTRGSVQARISRTQTRPAIQDASELPARGVNPSTGSTLAHLDPEDVDDTNVKSMWATRSPRASHVAAVIIGLLALTSGGMTVFYAVRVAIAEVDVKPPDPPLIDEVEGPPSKHAATEASPSVEQDPPPPKPAKPATAKAAAPVETEEGSKVEGTLAKKDDDPTLVLPPPEPPPEAKPPEAKPPETKPPETKPPPKAEAPKPLVEVTFYPNEFRYVDIKYGNKKVTLSGAVTRKLRSGMSHKIKILDPETGAWKPVGRIKLESGHNYKVLMFKSGPPKAEQID